MHATGRFSIFFFLALFLIHAAIAQAQESTTPSEHHDFFVTTSIGIGFSGTKVTTQFKLKDELGLEYDVMSLLLDSDVRKTINLSSDQYDEMRILHVLATTELTAQLTDQLLTDDPKGGLESRFRDLQGDLRSILDGDQESLLDRSRIQLGIKRYGLVKFLGTDTMKSELGLTDADLEKLATSDADSDANEEQQIKSLIKQANEALIETLSDSQRDQFDRLLAETATNAFMETALIVEGKSLKKRTAPPMRVLLGLLKRKKVQRDLKLTDSNIEEIKGLAKSSRKKQASEIERELKTILNDSQYLEIYELGVHIETAKYGTVDELCYGLLGQSLDLTDEDATRLHAAGKEIYSEFISNVKQAKADTFRESLGSLSTAKRNRVMESVGPY